MSICAPRCVKAGIQKVYRMLVIAIVVIYVAGCGINVRCYHLLATSIFARVILSTTIYICSSAVCSYLLTQVLRNSLTQFALMLRVNSASSGVPIIYLVHECGCPLESSLLRRHALESLSTCLRQAAFVSLQCRDFRDCQDCEDVHRLFRCSVVRTDREAFCMVVLPLLFH